MFTFTHNILCNFHELTLSTVNIQIHLTTHTHAHTYTHTYTLIHRHTNTHSCIHKPIHRSTGLGSNSVLRGTNSYGLKQPSSSWLMLHIYTRKYTLKQCRVWAGPVVGTASTSSSHHLVASVERGRSRTRLPSWSVKDIV